jgi:ABC-type multidrug transport system fused ATPase/permease subunit
MSVADKSDKKENGEGSRRSIKGGSTTVAQVRTRVAQVVWLIFVVAAVFLAVGALCVALDFNPKNPLVEFFIAGANFFDLDIFSRKGGIKTFDGSNADVKNAIFNWGIGAIVWLVVGRIVVRVIQP